MGTLPLPNNSLMLTRLAAENGLVPGLSRYARIWVGRCLNRRAA